MSWYQAWYYLDATLDWCVLLHPALYPLPNSPILFTPAQAKALQALKEKRRSSYWDSLACQETKRAWNRLQWGAWLVKRGKVGEW